MLGKIKIILVTGLLSAAALAAPDKEVEKALLAALKAENGEAIRTALLPVVQGGGAENAEFLLDTLEKMGRSSDKAYWQMVNATTSFSDDAALKAIGEYLVKNKKTALSRDLLFALQNNHSSAAAAAHALVLDKGADDMKPLSIDQLAAIESVAAVDVLIAAYKKMKADDPLAKKVDRALRILTGADCGSADNWAAWWANARQDGLKKRDADTSTGTVADDLDPSRADEFVGLETLAPEKIIVLKAKCPSGGCNFDDIERLLEKMKIPHTLVERDKFEMDPAILASAQVLISNCVQTEDHCICKGCKADMSSTTMRLGQCSGCDKHDIVNHKFKANTVKRIGEWVNAGGYFFSEDWGLTEVLEPNWAEMVKSGKLLAKGDTMAQPYRGNTSHPLLRGVFARDPNKKIGQSASDYGSDEGGDTVERGILSEALKTPEHYWHIDDDSPAIKVVGKAVTILLRSQDLLEQAEGNDAIAITFQPRGPKGGAVLHVLSHFGEQKSEVDEFAMQNLLLNFLLEATRRGS